MDEWNNIINKLKELPFTSKDARTFMRMFMSGATECELDKNGRINISQVLTNYAALNKECVVIGVNDRLEIWSKEKFENFFNDNIDNFSDIAENLFNAC
jgi:MraZ protein